VSTSTRFRVKATAMTRTAKTTEPSLVHVSPDLLYEHENDRSRVDPAGLKNLTESVKRLGILQPLTVARDGEGFRVIAGHRRLLAARKAKRPTVPCHVVGDLLAGDIDDATIAEARLAENYERADLDAIEKAHAVNRLITDHNRTPKQVAQLLHVSASQVSNMVRLLQLPPIWQQWVADGKVAATAARSLVAWKNRPQVFQHLVDQHSDQIDRGEFTLTDERIARAVEAVTCSLTCLNHQRLVAPSKRSCYFKFDAGNAEERKALDAQEIPGVFGKEWRAWNVEEWQRRNAPEFKKAKAAHQLAREKASAANGTTPAKAKAKAKAKAEDQPGETEPDRMALEFHLTAWTCRQLAEGVRRADSITVATRVLFYLCLSDTFEIMGHFGLGMGSTDNPAPKLPTANQLLEGLQAIPRARTERWAIATVADALEFAATEAEHGRPLADLDNPGSVLSLFDVGHLKRPLFAWSAGMLNAYKPAGLLRLYRVFVAKNPPDDLDAVRDALLNRWKSKTLPEEIRALYRPAVEPPKPHGKKRGA
jgi:ParB/RepB/Spo0J family partition protein